MLFSPILAFMHTFPQYTYFYKLWLAGKLHRKIQKSVNSKVWVRSASHVVSESAYLIDFALNANWFESLCISTSGPFHVEVFLDAWILA